MSSAMVTGAAGQLGSDLCRAAGARGLEVHGFDRRGLDVTDREAVIEAVSGIAPAVVFNCAAFHQLDACEADIEAARAVNVAGVRNLRDACDELAAGCRLVHVSTNYVFDGRRETAAGGYDEDQHPNPVQAYGLSKLEGEHEAGPEALIVRTAGLYGQSGSASKGGNFVDRMLERDDRITMVADQLVNPTSTADLAEAMLEAWQGEMTGVLHLVNSGSCSWLEFTEAILKLAGRDNPVIGVESDPQATPRRPLNGALASIRSAPQMRPWQDALAEYVANR
jgi:dTDP-4-dehydrorhamnose reductase